MGAHLDRMPKGYFACQWCGGGVRYEADGSWPSRCTFCGMHPHPSKVDETVGGKVDPATAKRSARNRRGQARATPLSQTPEGRPVLGVDPGARYTGVVLRDGDVCLLASTLVRQDSTDPVAWARQVVEEVKTLLRSGCPSGTRVAIEGVSAPKGFKHGQRASIDPGPILMAGVVMGALAATWPDAVVIPPGGNGSQHVTHYPPDLVGARPSALAGASNGARTRAHEQSAYDVAGKAAKVLYPRVPLQLPAVR